MKYYFVNRKLKSDNLFIGLSSFNNFLWLQGLMEVTNSLILNSMLLMKYDIVDLDKKIYNLSLFLDIVEKLKNKN